MRYMGGKGRLAKKIAAEIATRRGDREWYLEPFLGGAFAFAEIAPMFRHAIAADAMEDLALLWSAVAEGWEPPAAVSREEYAALKLAAPSPLRAFVGFGVSFGGKWWGGYTPVTGPRAKSAIGDDPCRQGAAQINRKRPALAGAAHVLHSDYRALLADDRFVVYCDPPYAGTTTYAGVEDFDTQAFWSWAEASVARGALVFVSEYSAPPGWMSVWSHQAQVSMAASGNDAKATEFLFMHHTQADAEAIAA